MNRKFVQIGAAALLMLILPALSAVRADPVVIVDPTIQYGAWEGWGTSLAWWAKVVGGFPEPARSDYMTKAFDPVKGLGLNVVRYNIGGGENPLYQAPNKETLSFRRCSRLPVHTRWCLGLGCRCQPALGAEIGDAAQCKPAGGLFQLPAVVGHSQRQCRRRARRRGSPAPGLG